MTDDQGQDRAHAAGDELVVALAHGCVRLHAVAQMHGKALGSRAGQRLRLIGWPALVVPS